MWYIVVLVVVSGALAISRDDCDKAVGIELEYVCQYNRSSITFASRNDYVNIQCEGKSKNLTCKDLPELDFAKSLPLRSLGVVACPPSLLLCIYDIINTTSIDYVTLTRMSAPLTEEDVRHLGDIKMLMILQADAQKFIPIGGINSLKNVRDLRIGGGDFQLSPRLFAEAPPLEYLELHSNNLRSIPVDAFVGMHGLRELNIWGNYIPNITVGAFSGLNNLRTLTLNRNEIVYMEPGVFESTPHLGSLDLVENYVKLLPNGLFRGMDQLENITIFMNLVDMELDTRAFSDLTKLKTIDLSQNGIGSLPRYVFHNSTNMEKLDLNSNNIKSLHSSLFTELSKLKYIDLSHNKIDALSSDVFVGLKSLEYLNMNRNHLETLPENLFFSQKKLKELHLDNNLLNTIAFTAFQGASNLEILSLAMNKLTFVQRTDTYESSQFLYTPLQHVQKLRKLNLKGNKINVIFDDWRLVLLQLVHLDLSRNQFDEIDSQQIDFLSESVTVDLRYNNISHIDINPNTEPWMVMKPTEEVTKSTEVVTKPPKLLLLDYNPIICDCYLYRFKLRINKIDILKNDFKIVVDRAWCASPPNLKGELVKQVPMDSLVCPIPQLCPYNCTCEAKVANNEFIIDCYHLPPVLPDTQSTNFNFYFIKKPTITLRLQKQPHNIDNYDIHTLNLSDTNMENIYFRPSVSLKVLDVSDNRIGNIPLDFIEASVKLYLANNAFECECWNSDHLLILRDYYNNTPDFDEIRCTNGEYITNLDISSLCYTMKANITALCTFAVLTVIFLICCMLTYRYNNEIMLYLSTKCCKRWILSIKQGPDNTYDLFISFAHPDFDFVADELLPKLENDFNQKVCVHYRDWPIGDMIPTSIVRSVEESRKTVIVLTESYLSSNWANLEFNAAHNLALQEGEPKVILVLLKESIAKNEKLSPELKAYINTNTYLVWGDPKFWDRLKKVLPRTEFRFKFVEAVRKRGDSEKSLNDGLDVQLNNQGKLINMATKNLEIVDNFQDFKNT